MNFQQILTNLQNYWAAKGCLIWLPYSEKVGAGTGNPATALRVLGPEPWKVAYAEPSYRPDDGRYAENPNRMQMHTQYQVILKPAPSDIQQLYLESLEAIGIRIEDHDVRFVEDNWESPALGAWGLGWEVWLDGLEITQFTYFQQAGGCMLNPVSVEITYGLERIAMFLQGVREVWKIDWDGQHSYADIFRQSEIENCVYNFELADVTHLKQLYELFESEIHNALSRHLVTPAYDYLLRCSHTFNVLDARGAIGVTERAGYFSRMRDLARAISSDYLEQRNLENYPWLNKAVEQKQEKFHLPLQNPENLSSPTPNTYLLEIGVEELPPSDALDALHQLQEIVPQMMSKSGLEYQQVRVMGTPRRLVVIVEELVGMQKNETIEIKGPPASLAFDPDGLPTKALIGFCQKNGVNVDELLTRENDAGSYIYARLKRPGQRAEKILLEVLPTLLAEIHFGKTMRWNTSNCSFSRPVRWFVSLLGRALVPFAYAGVTAGRVTYGPRAAFSCPIEVDDPADYLRKMEEYQVILDFDQRRRDIVRQATAIAQKVGGTIPDDPALLEEVTNLVEQPSAILGEFNSDFLNLPKEILISVMKKHQRYFPLVDCEQKLMPRFIVIRNGPPDHRGIVRDGNEAVLQARFADSMYFYKADTQQNLEDYAPKLSTLIFHEKLGSMEDKSNRVRKLVPFFQPFFNLSPEEVSTTERAAQLYKNDLVTHMVIEITALQGIMGSAYARLSGETEAVATTIFEHYLPRYQGDVLPRTLPGLALGVINRLDSLVGLFAAGITPSGSADPYGLRRDALGLVQILIGRSQSFDLSQAIQIVADMQPIPISADITSAVALFVRGRLYRYLRDQGYTHDVVMAVLKEKGMNPFMTYTAVEELVSLMKCDDWQEIFSIYTRCKRISANFRFTSGVIDVDRDEEPMTKHLYSSWQLAISQLDDSVTSLGIAYKTLTPHINQFFEHVVVMTDDETIQNLRMGVLKRISEMGNGIVDLSTLQGF